MKTFSKKKFLFVFFKRKLSFYFFYTKLKTKEKIFVGNNKTMIVKPISLLSYAPVTIEKRKTLNQVWNDK